MEDESLLDLERILDGDKAPTDLPLALLKSITNNFSKERKIGGGAFGAVYKGVFRERVVAVKRIYVNIERLDDDDKQFGREINFLWNTNHPNVVRFLGFCSNIYQKNITKDGEIILANVRERLFCFEYISNGSLDKHITDELRGLEWKIRYEIITGICVGLHYLHERKNIIHMDLKPANVLLDHQDGKYIPKITDFGLSRPNENSHTVGNVYGTLGYWAPENRERGKTTSACDIYSLGAIISELVAGSIEVPNKDKVLRRWRHRWRKPPTLLQYHQVTRCIEIAEGCRETKPEDRPSIKAIIDFLSESMDGHTGQEISNYLNDDMLGIEPLQLHLNTEMSWLVKLTNKTKTCFSFNIEGPSQRYTIRPEEGIVPPGSEILVQVAVQPHESAPLFMQNGDKFIVRSTKDEADEVVDEVDLMVVLVYEPVSPKATASSSYVDAAQQKIDRCNFQPPENFARSRATNRTYLLNVRDRAMDVTTGAFGSLLHKLGVLNQEFNLKTSIEKDVDELVKMQQILQKLSNVQQDNLDGTIKIWANNVRDMSYDIEDFVDGFLVDSNLAHSDGSSSRELTHEMYLEKGKSRQAVGDLIRHNISKQVQDEAKKCKECKADSVVADATTKTDIKDRRLSALYEDKELLIGIEAPKKKLISLLEEDGDMPKEKLRVVSIVGMGGLGKTTLANAVFKHLKAKYNHKTLVWVGQNPDVEKVLAKIIRKLTKNSPDANCDLDELIEELREFLEDKRYLIVIDDIWDSKSWDLISSAFPQNNHGSRVITTTRIDDVALACCNSKSKYVHNMQQLSEEHSRELFFGRTFGPGKDCTDEQKGISIDILKKCGGMPLAINSIASLLIDQPRSTWDYVRKTLGDIVEENPRIGNVKQILDLSYMHLPDHLKTCLLYICKYQEDETIHKNDLLRQWVAEGFVVSNNGRLDAEDVAETYFKALINMCMIQPWETDHNDEVLSCRVHDIILELIRSKSSELNFFHVVDGLKDMTGEVSRIRRVSIHCNYNVESTTMNGFVSQCSHVRSVYLYGVPQLVPCFLLFKYIRVLLLYLKPMEDQDLSGISRLFLLRYIKIEGIIDWKLPDKIGELQQLETLHLKGFMPSRFPSDIASLPWLTNLICEFVGVVLPEGIGRLKSLRTLEGVDVYASSVENIKGIGELTKLRSLKIYLCTGKEERIATEALLSSISRLSTSLRVLSVRGSFMLDGQIWTRPLFPRGSCMLDDQIWTRPLFPRGSCIGELHLCNISFQRCPEWIGQLHDLYSLTIEVLEVADVFSIVAALPSLVFLRLYMPDSGTKEQTSVVISGSIEFQALKHLDLHCYKTSLTFELGALPKLEKLSLLITHRVLPVDVGHLPALKEISLIVSHTQDDWKVKGAEHWNNLVWDRYWCSDHYRTKLEEHKRRMMTLLRRGFRLHQPSADIYINFGLFDNHYTYIAGNDDEEGHEEPVDEERDEDAYDDEDYCPEDYRTSSDEDKESVDDEEEDDDDDDRQEDDYESADDQEEDDDT